MKKTATLLMFLFAASPAHAKFKVMVLDSGLDGKNAKLMKYVPKYARNKTDLKDWNGHGTHVFGLIAKAACDGVELIPCRGFLENDKGVAAMACWRRALALGVDVVNYSGGGTDFDPDEKAMMNRLEDQKTKVVAAAGNEDSDLAEKPFYPASLPNSNIVVVGNKASTNLRSPASNYGWKVTAWEYGENVESDAPGGKKAKMTGTSQATAKYTAGLVRAYCESKK